MLLTVGYQGRTPDEFVELIAFWSVDVLVDVRLNPVSRKRGFSKRALGELSEAAGVEYRHERELGNPKDNRDGFRGDGLEVARARYAAHLDNGARDKFREVRTLARSARVALLCVEQDVGRCHRSVICDRAREEDPALVIAHF